MQNSETSLDEFGFEVDGWLPVLPEVHLPRLSGQILADVVHRKSVSAGGLDGWGWRELKVFPVPWFDGLLWVLLIWMISLRRLEVVGCLCWTFFTILLLRVICWLMLFGERSLRLVVWMVGELKALPPPWFDGLARILTKVEDIGVWPDGLLDAYIAMIPKTDGNATPLGQRPLTVLPVVYRVWASARMNQLDAWFKSWVPDSVFSAGGGRGSVEAWYTSALDIEEVLFVAADSHFHLFVADVVKPFDTVDRSILDRVLSSLGLPGWFRHAYFEYHAHVRLRFKLASGLGRSWTRDGGIPQGCPLSMMFIVALYLPWCRYLSAQVGVRPQLYADNLKCLSLVTLQQHTTTHNHHTTTTQPPHNQHTTNTQPTHNQHTTNTQPTHNQHTTNTQPTHNQHTTNTQPTHNQHTTNNQQPTTTTRDGGIPQGCPLSIMFIVALDLPWCRYLAAHGGFSLSCMLINLSVFLGILVYCCMLLDLLLVMSG